MLYGDKLTLRPMREADLDTVYAAHVDIRSRGRFFPLGVQSEPAFKRAFAENGFWDRDEGTLLLITREGEIAGHIEFFHPVSYWDAWELSYQLYDERFAGHGYTTEAVQLLVDYLFGAKKQHRIQLDIVPDNAASRRIAEKCGFTLEGTARAAFFNDGQNQDLLIYSLLRTDPRPLGDEPRQGPGDGGGRGRRRPGSGVRRVRQAASSSAIGSSAGTAADSDFSTAASSASAADSAA